MKVFITARATNNSSCLRWSDVVGARWDFGQDDVAIVAQFGGGCFYIGGGLSVSVPDGRGRRTIWDTRMSVDLDSVTVGY